MSKGQEIEIRGKLSKADFERLTSLLKVKGKLQKHYSRLSVDLSPGFNSKTRSWEGGSKFDLRLKKSGTTEKISLKIGQFHLKKRREVEVEIQEGQFLNALSVLEILGYGKGMIYFWESWEYSYQGFEVKLSKYTKDYYTWEIEALEKDADPSSLAKLLNLKPYSKKEYKEAIDWENKNIHKLYSLERVKALIKKSNKKLR
jgi:hypothetical protein